MFQPLTSVSLQAALRFSACLRACRSDLFHHGTCACWFPDHAAKPAPIEHLPLPSSLLSCHIICSMSWRNAFQKGTFAGQNCHLSVGNLLACGCLPAYHAMELHSHSLSVLQIENLTPAESRSAVLGMFSENKLASVLWLLLASRLIAASRMFAQLQH